MERFYNRAEDKNVSAVKVFKKSGDDYAYIDSDKTVKLTATKLKNLFVKGCLVIDGDNIYAPTGFTLTSGVGTLTYVVATSETSAVGSVVATLKSSEYTAPVEEETP